MIAWLKSKWNKLRAKIRTKLDEGLGFLEEVAEYTEQNGPEFLALIEAHGRLVEEKMVQLEALAGLTGNQKFIELAEWVRIAIPEFNHHIRALRAWASAAVAIRKAQGLFR